MEFVNRSEIFEYTYVLIVCSVVIMIICHIAWVTAHGISMTMTSSEDYIALTAAAWVCSYDRSEGPNVK